MSITMIVGIVAGIVLALVVACVILLANPLVVLGWMFFILSVSFFGTAVGTFINVSLPQNAGSSIKAIVQMVFLYVGMLPAIAAVLIGVFAHVMVPALLIGAAVDIGLGTLFCCFTPHFLENK